MVSYLCQVKGATLTGQGRLPKVNRNKTHGQRKHLANSKQNVRKSLRNLLTNSRIYDTIKMFQGRGRRVTRHKEVSRRTLWEDSILTYTGRNPLSCNKNLTKKILDILHEMW